MIMVFGEITTKAKVDYEAIVRRTCKEIGFTSDDVGLDGDKCKVGEAVFQCALQSMQYTCYCAKLTFVSSLISL